MIFQNRYILFKRPTAQDISCYVTNFSLYLNLGSTEIFDDPLSENTLTSTI